MVVCLKLILACPADVTRTQRVPTEYRQETWERGLQECLLSSDFTLVMGREGGRAECFSWCWLCHRGRLWYTDLTSLALQPRDLRCLGPRRHWTPGKGIVHLIKCLYHFMEVVEVTLKRDDVFQLLN